MQQIINMASEFQQLIVCLLTAVTLLTQSRSTVRAQESYIILHPADTNVTIATTISLSCVAISNTTNSPVTIQWTKNDSLTTTPTSTTPAVNVDIPSVTENLTLSNGTKFYISTIVLCNTEFEDAGSYVCSLPATGSQESVLISVYIQTTARFQLRLTGVGHCGNWMNDDSNDIQDVITHLTTHVLDSICTAPPPADTTDCFFNIINPQLNCIFSTESDSVTFSAVLEYQAIASRAVSLYQQASDIVSIIEAWKDEGDRVIVINSLELTVQSDCVIDSVVPCGEIMPDSEVTFTPARNDNDGRLTTVVSILVIFIVLTGVMLVIIVVLIVKMYASKKQIQPVNRKKRLELSTSMESNLAYGEKLTNFTKEGTILTQNEAYSPTTMTREVAIDHSTHYEYIPG